MTAQLAPASKRIKKILAEFDKGYPDARCTLSFSNPMELLVATILSAQCTDVLVNKVTPVLFKKYKTIKDYALSNPSVFEQDVSRVNFYRNKAKNIRSAAQTMIERFGGKVPDSMVDLIQLPGVARKTANVILGNAFGKNSGIVVDTHVMRLSQRIGLTKERDRDKIEQDLIGLVPNIRWVRFGHQMILHGRQICTAKKPRCQGCPLGKMLCPSYETY